MSGMSRNRAFRITLGFLALAFITTGCGPDPKQQKIDELTAENDQLKKELEERDRRLNDGLVRDGDSQATIDELNRQLAKLRAEAAARPKTTPAKEGEWATFDNFAMISVPGSVLFDAGSAQLSPSGRSKVSQIASDIRGRYADRDIYVVGHTDDQPIRKSKWKDNWELGAQRALTVIRSLRDQGVPNESLVQANCGEWRPKVKGKDEKSRLSNRRVEFYAVKRNVNSLDPSASALRNSTDE